MNHRKYADLVFNAGVAVLVLVGLVSIPLFMTDPSWRSAGMIVAASAAGVMNMVVGKLMKRLP